MKTGEAFNRTKILHQTYNFLAQAEHELWLLMWFFWYCMPNHSSCRLRSIKLMESASRYVSVPYFWMMDQGWIASNLTDCPSLDTKLNSVPWNWMVEIILIGFRIPLSDSSKILLWLLSLCLWDGREQSVLPNGN